jgi:crotonobetainyl-CoA:carnitine CoA-transferase CaiB-like acyl-CoA transferase
VTTDHDASEGRRPPLEGVRVLDVSRVFAGPVAGRTLADLGADVVKVEQPDGDITRLWGRKVADLSTYFTQQNCGKRNVCIDLRSDGGAALIGRLAERADVLIENFRPGVMARHGLDWPTLSARHPGLVMLSISGFGQIGPDAQRAAYAAIIHAEAGLVTSIDGSPPTDVPFSAADVLTGMHGVIGVLAALRVRDATGVGQHIDLAMLDAMAFSSDTIIASLDGYPRTDDVKGEVWDTGAGPMMITGGLKWVWHQLSNVHGLHDPTPAGADIAEKIAARRRIATEFLCALPDRQSVIEALDAAGLAWGELRSGRSVVEAPTMRERSSVSEIDDRAGSTREVVRAPYRMSHSDTSDVGVAAHRGEHNGEVLADWLELPPEDVDALLADGVLHLDQWAAAAGRTERPPADAGAPGAAGDPDQSALAGIPDPRDL